VNQPASLAPEVSRADRRRDAIIKAAVEVFLNNGYLGATTDEVATRASVSKQTLYKQFADKQRLFAEVILNSTIQVGEGLATAAADALRDATDVRKALREVADIFLRSMLKPEVVRLRRLVIAEADRFPEVGQAWYEHGFERTLVAVGEALTGLADRGLLRNIADPTLAAHQFAGLVMYQPMNQLMFAGTQTRPSPAKLRRIADGAVDMFLATYG
jgi:TetR/AcrR family transcriptional repressor of mexJK operon